MFLKVDESMTALGFAWEKMQEEAFVWSGLVVKAEAQVALEDL